MSESTADCIQVMKRVIKRLSVHQTMMYIREWPGYNRTRKGSRNGSIKSQMDVSPGTSRFRNKLSMDVHCIH